MPERIQKGPLACHMWLLLPHVDLDFDKKLLMPFQKVEFFNKIKIKIPPQGPTQTPNDHILVVG